ncbi:MAG: flagellar motor switch phosphatase FliY [Lachnospirales bacterium]
MGDMLTQDEINTLLNNESSSDIDVEDMFTSNELRIFEEISRETMDVSKNILERLANKPVVLGDPKLQVIKLSDIKNHFTTSCVSVKIDYISGLEGMSVLVLSVKDARIISELMFGNDVTEVDTEEPLNELELSTTGESMNQMIGSTSTVLSEMIQTKVDIGIPDVRKIDFSDFKVEDLGVEEDTDVFFNVFDMKIDKYVEFRMMQIFPVNFAKKILGAVIEKGYEFNNGFYIKNGKLEKKKLETNKLDTGNKDMQNASMDSGVKISHDNQSRDLSKNGNISAKNVEFQDLMYQELNQQKENIELVMDVPLEVTVEMGRTNRTVKEILGFSPGTIIELDKLAGDPIDILVNGKFVAKGEVVVIDENYGIRITDIVSTSNRI